MSCDGSSKKAHQHFNAPGSAGAAAFGSADAAVVAMEQITEVSRNQARRQMREMDDNGSAPEKRLFKAQQQQATRKTAQLFRTWKHALGKDFREPAHGETDPKMGVALPDDPAMHFGYAAVYDTQQALQGKGAMPDVAKRVMDAAQRRHVKATGADALGYNRCSQCGRFASNSKAHTCPLTASPQTMAKALSKRLKVPASSYTGTPQSKAMMQLMLNEARDTGTVLMRHALTGEHIAATLDGALLALQQGYSPEEWGSQSSGTLAVTPDNRVVRVLNLGTLNEYQPTGGAVAQAAAAYGAVLPTGTPMASGGSPTPPAATGGPTSVQGGAAYNEGRFVGSLFKKKAARGDAVQADGTTYHVGAKLPDGKEHWGAARRAGKVSPPPSGLVVGRAVLEAAELLKSAKVNETPDGVIEIYTSDGSALLAAYDPRTGVAGDVNGTENLSAEQLAAVIMYRAQDNQNTLDHYLSQDVANLRAGKGRATAVADSAYCSIRRDLAQGGTMAFGGTLGTQRCPDCGQFMGTQHTCPAAAAASMPALPSTLSGLKEDPEMRGLADSVIASAQKAPSLYYARSVLSDGLANGLKAEYLDSLGMLSDDDKALIEAGWGGLHTIQDDELERYKRLRGDIAKEFEKELEANDPSLFYEWYEKEYTSTASVAPEEEAPALVAGAVEEAAPAPAPVAAATEEEAAPASAAAALEPENAPAAAAALEPENAPAAAAALEPENAPAAVAVAPVLQLPTPAPALDSTATAAIERLTNTLERLLEIRLASPAAPVPVAAPAPAVPANGDASAVVPAALTEDERAARRAARKPLEKPARPGIDIMPTTVQEHILANVTPPAAADAYLSNLPARIGGDLDQALDLEIPAVDPNFEVDESTEKALRLMSAALQVAWSPDNNTPQSQYASFGLYGPPGTGKNTTARQMAAVLGLPYVEMTVNPDTSAQDEIGRTILEDGSTRAQLGKIGLAAAAGGVICVNEIVRNPRMATAFQGMMEDRVIEIQGTEGGIQRIPVHPSTVFVMTWNPGMEGDDDRPAGAPLARMMPIELKRPSTDEQAERLMADFYRMKGKQGDVNGAGARREARRHDLLQRTYKIKPIEPTMERAKGVARLMGDVQALAKEGQLAIGGSNVSPGPREARRFMYMVEATGDPELALEQLKIYCDQDPASFETQWSAVMEVYRNVYGDDGQALFRPSALPNA